MCFNSDLRPSAEGFRCIFVEVVFKKKKIYGLNWCFKRLTNIYNNLNE